jgi:hypothetical protein
MSTIFSVSEQSHTHFLGTRYSGRQLRAPLEDILSKSDNIAIDFSGIHVTQSFIDELIGTLILKYGPDLLTHLSFKGCSEDVKAIINFVVTTRINDYNQNKIDNNASNSH